MTKDTLLLKGPHPLKNEYKKSLKLTQTQRDIIVGTLLGDAHIESRGNSSRYYFNQKESQLSYVYHVYSHFEAWCSKQPQIATSGTTSSGEQTKFFYFRTCSHPAFEFYAHQFYSSNRAKVIPELLHK
jgi:hypothetical protein